jgi:PilZ domain
MLGYGVATIAAGGRAESRLHPRIEYRGLISISWKAFDGQLHHVLGKCIDVSERGVGFELPTRIPIGSFVNVRAYALNLDGPAIVRHVARRAGKYVLGLELSTPLDSDFLTELLVSQTEVVAEIPS